MARLDLHMHSTCSDGTKPPEWVVQRAAANGAELIALTDHDTLAGVEAARAEGHRQGIDVVAGVEIGVHESGLGELHVLGYFPDQAPLNEVEDQLTAFRTDRESRAERTVERLVDLGLDIEYEAVVDIADGAAIGRPHIARALLEAGHVESVQEAFDRYLKNDGPAYVARKLLSLSESIEMIHLVGGFSSLAHPTRYEAGEQAVYAFADSGGDGLEIYYRRDGPEAVAHGLQLAQRLRLTPTVGSDFHGLHADEMQPATVTIPDHDATRMIEILRDLSP